MALSKEAILAATDGGLDIFKRYITTFPGVGKAFLNPFYDDTKPSAYVYRQKDCGNYSFVDHGNLDYIGDCFTFIGWIFNKNTNDRDGFIDVMEIINREFNLGLSNNKDKVRELTNRYPNTIKKASEVDPLTISENREEVSKRFLEPQYKAFTPNEQMYWLMYGVNMDTIKRYNVRSVKTFRGVTKDDKEYSIESTDSEPIFAYPGQGYVKIYAPAPRTDSGIVGTFMKATPLALNSSHSAVTYCLSQVEKRTC